MTTQQNDHLDFAQRARTKIVATVGPACSREDQLAELVRAGVDVFRINMAHSDTDAADEIMQSIRRVSGALDCPIAVLIDLAGPKIRLGELPGGQMELVAGARIDIVRGETSGEPDTLTSNYQPLIDEVSPGNEIMLADATVSLVVETKTNNRLQCTVRQPGTLRSRQGINLPGVKLSAPTLEPDDLRHAEWAAKAGADFVSLSFVRAASDVQQLKDLLRSHGSPAPVIAKIEKLEALECLEEIVRTSDGVMVARGDLGVETDVAMMPMEQKRIVAMCRRYQRPVIIATQMLESMCESRRPTRAEATDVANAILDGCDACMLSGETAIGKYPVAAVSMMNRIALATESGLADRPLATRSDHAVEGIHEITHSVAYGAGIIAHELKARLVVVASHSGRTALAISSQRSFVPTIGVSPTESTLRQMCLYWGVTPLRGLPARDFELLIKHSSEWGRATANLSVGDFIVIVGGSHLTAGVHDMLVVHKVGE